jgi:hypothetical protein
MQKQNQIQKQIKIYKGHLFHKPAGLKANKKKVVVLDLDETIGSFADLEILWTALCELDVFEQTQESFNKLLDLYPEFLRYGILNILDFLYYKKTRGFCYKLFIYTNNRFPKSWTTMIIRYLEKKQNNPCLFDQLICAFKINDCIVEPKRTTHSKTHGDLIRCSLLPKTSEICFVDDKYFDNMTGGCVYYIQPKPYNHMMLTCDIIERLCKSNLIGDSNLALSHFLEDKFYNFNTVVKSDEEIAIDRSVSQKLMFHIQEFFHLTTSSNRTQKTRNYSVGKFTRKRARTTSSSRVHTP